MRAFPIFAGISFAAMAVAQPKVPATGAFLPPGSGGIFMPRTVLDPSGDAFVAATNQASSTSFRAHGLMRIAPSGAVRWYSESVITGCYSASTDALFRLSGGDLLVVGTARKGQATPVRVVRFGPDGTVRWTTWVPASDYAASQVVEAVVDGEDQLTLLASENDGLARTRVSLLAKVAPTGQVGWTYRFQRTAPTPTASGTTEYGRALALDRQGNAWALVSTYGVSANTFAILRVDPLGSGTMVKLLDYGRDGMPTDLAIDRDGSLLAMINVKYQAGRYDWNTSWATILARMDTTGEEIARREIWDPVGLLPIEGFRLFFNPTGGINLAGRMNDTFMAMRFDDALRPLWRTLGPSGTPSDVKLDSVGAMLFTGNITDDNHENRVLAWKVSPWGREAWAAKIPAEGDVYAIASMDLAPDGNLFVAGSGRIIESRNSVGFARVDQGVGLAGFLLGADTILGGKPLVGRVLLTRRAPRGGITVRLLSADPAVQVPPSVRVEEGTFGMKFPVQSQGVADDQRVVVTAQTNSEIYRTKILLFSPTIGLFTPERAEMKGNSSQKITLNLIRQFPGLIELTLSCSRPDLIYVADKAVYFANTTENWFTVNAPAVAEPTPVTITASGRGDSKSIRFTIIP